MKGTIISHAQAPSKTAFKLDITFWSFSSHLAVNSSFYIRFKSKIHL